MKFIESNIPCIENARLYDLNDEDHKWLKKTAESSIYYCNINGIIYHKKMIEIEDAINELLGKIISEYFGDEQTKSQIIKGEYNFFLLTENFIEKGKTYTALNSGIFPKLRFDENSRLDIKSLDYLDRITKAGFGLKTNKEDLKKLQYQLKMMIINDFIRNHFDRWYHNFLIEYKNTHCKLMPLYDFEFSFLSEYDEDLKNCFKFDLGDETVIKYIKKDEQFQEILHLAMELDMKKIFERLFDEYPVSMTEDEQALYENIIETKKEEINGYKLIK